MPTTSTTYDEVPYDSNPFPDTHPRVTSAVSLLFGLRTPEPESARILELGCAAGGNLIPMSLSLPQSRCVGIDLSARQIADGQAIVDRLGLSNIELRAESILDVSAEWGQFDYIICHGVYSWVPPVVQDKILKICSENLSPNGVAYVSYNTYPGWHTRGVVRDIMRYHVTPGAPGRVRVQEAREFLEFLVETVPIKNSLYGLLLLEEEQNLRSRGDSYVLHEQLEEFNEPVYFHEFARRAGAHGLQYVCEAQIGNQFIPLPPAALEKLASRSQNQIEYEQRLDFLRGQTFRRTLLCRTDVTLRPPPPASEALFELHLAIRDRVEPTSAQPDVRSDSVEKFTTSRGGTMSISDPVTKAALVCLRECWPQIVSFESLRQQVIGRLAGDAGPHPDFDEHTSWQRLSEPLLECVLSGLVWIYRSAPHVARVASERPVGCALARLQAGASQLVTCRAHVLVDLGEIERLILSWLDGSQSRENVLDRFIRAVVAGDVELSPGPDGVAGSVDRESLREMVEASLKNLAAARVLVS